jgi:hypothetical protein
VRLPACQPLKTLPGKPTNKQGNKLRSLGTGELLKGFPGDQIDRCLGHDSAILDLDVRDFGCDLLENGGIENSFRYASGTNFSQHDL